MAERTVFDNVALPLRVTGAPERDVARRVRAALSLVGLLGKEPHLPRQLSTGEQQRVGIARAVVGRPKILLADEPTGNLDPELSRDIMDVFRQFNQLGTTVIVASHDRELIESMGMRIIELAQGAIVWDSGGRSRGRAPASVAGTTASRRVDLPPAGASSCTMRLSDLLSSCGNGCAGSIASGVSNPADNGCDQHDDR